jgi:rhamnose utilization protein RhaD (predicted bifunctional aldolase and dehydrogenase)
MKKEDFKHVEYRWDDDHATSLEAVERLVYRSNILGGDQRITNTGGGNTSSKVTEQDAITQEPVEVLWVKGSGGDLRTVERDGFASLCQKSVVSLQRMYRAAPEQGAKTPIEDKMVSMYRHCTFKLNPRAASIDTPLHSFVPRFHVDHTHPNACIAVAASKDQEKLTREIYGDQVGWVPWKRPGFDLGLDLQHICETHPQYEGVILGQHGLINWADDDKECYELTLGLIEKAARYIEAHDRGEDTFGGQKYRPLDEGARRAVLMEVLPWLRGRIGCERKVIATKQTNLRLQRYVNSHDAARLAEMGTS